MGTLEARLNDQLAPVVQPPPAVAKPSGNTNHSIETLVVVLAVITIAAVIAGIIARLCGGRHFGGNGEHDIEGWVESRCRNCIDGGVPAAPPPPAEAKPAAAAAEAKPAAAAAEAKPAAAAAEAKPAAAAAEAKPAAAAEEAKPAAAAEEAKK